MEITCGTDQMERGTMFFMLEEELPGTQQRKQRCSECLQIPIRCVFKTLLALDCFVVVVLNSKCQLQPNCSLFLLQFGERE